MRAFFIGLLVFAVASALRCLPFKRRPCAGRHLLFFAAAKKSRQKKAANTASSSSCLRAPKGSYASNGNHVTHVRCQRSCGAPHPLHAPALQHAMPAIPPPPRWQTVCRLSRRIAWRSYRVEHVRYRSGVRRLECYGLHTVCHLGGANHSLPLALVRVFEVGEAIIRSVGDEREQKCCRVKRKTLWGPSGKNKCWRC